jgi:predicted molibdopterin-dependent oxidoreductase YjgC
MPSSQARFVRLSETDRPSVDIVIDSVPVTALEGDTVLVALLTNGRRLRRSEFGGEVRAGFCLMAACQDCWVWTVAGERLRACDTPVRTGLSIVTQQPDSSWLSRG